MSNLHPCSVAGRKPDRQLDFLLNFERANLIDRLEKEGEFALAEKLAECGLEFPLLCTKCGSFHKGETRCKKRWCPVCQKSIAARNKEAVQAIVANFQWPLHVMLSCKNTPSPAGLSHLRKSFQKFRRWKLWTSRVKGGVCGYEITNRGQGFHPHAHLLIDCRWLSLTVKEPSFKAHPELIEARCKAAQQELSVAWGKALNQKQGAIVWVERVSAEDAIQEVLKYALKTSEMLELEGKIGPTIKAIQACRTMTTFGKAYGKPRKPQKKKAKCKMCGAEGGLIPEDEFHAAMRG